jgi:ribosome maturation factor RimP
MKGGLEAAAILARAACSAASVLPVTNWAAIIRPFRVKLKWAELSSPFFLLDRLSPGRRLLAVPRLERLIEAARPGGKGRAARSVGSSQLNQGQQGLRQASGNSKATGKSARGAKPQRQREGAAASGRPGRPDRPVRPAPAPREIPAGPRLGWREAITATVTGQGFELIEVERAQRGLLRITIDRIPGRVYPVASEFILVEDCEQVTRQLQYALEVEDMDYARLEVSSPGLDRPLKSEADFERFAGQAVKITLKTPFEGRKVWEGVLSRAGHEQPAAVGAEGAADGTSANGWSLVFKAGKTEQVLGFKFEEVREARLVPVLDFKGRKTAGSAAGSDQVDAPPESVSASGTDGG